MKISVTERQAFKQCRKRWQYQYVQKLIPIQQQSSALWIGIAVHAALEAFYKKNDAMTALNNWWTHNINEAPDIVKNSAEQTWQLMSSMVTQYVQYAKTADEGWNVLQTEQFARAAIPNTYGGELVGRLDLLINWNDAVWVVDHKTAASFISAAALEFNDQTTAYMWLTQKTLGITAKGAIYNQLKKKIAEKPMLLKTKAALSKNKLQSTTAALYRQAIKENNLDIADYADILQFLDDNPTLFKREYITRTQRELKSFESALAVEHDEMLRAKQDCQHLCYRTATQNCAWCPYALLCKADAADDQYQVDEIKRSLFYTRQKKTTYKGGLK